MHGKLGGYVVAIAEGDEVVRHDMGGLIEPEGGNAVKDQALVGNGGWQDDVEGGDAVRGDEQQMLR